MIDRQKWQKAFVVTALLFTLTMSLSFNPVGWLLKLIPGLILWRVVKDNPFYDVTSRRALRLGLFFCLLGDLVLHLSFEAGFYPALYCFSAGYALYALAFFRLRQRSWNNAALVPALLVLGAAAAVVALLPLPDASAWTVGEHRVHPEHMYLGVLTLMTLSALAMRMRAWHVFAGCAVLMISDGILAVHAFGGGFPLDRHVVIVTYYLGQYLILFPAPDQNSSTRSLT